jgi:hypothetical protein
MLLGMQTCGRVRAPSSRIRFVEIIASNIALILLSGELALRAYGAVSGQSLLVSDTLEAHRLIFGRDYGHGLRGNRLGYPGPDRPHAKPDGVCRIAALGDSFAVGPAVAFEENFLTRLEKSLRGVEVLNFGVSGAGPREYLAVLERDVWPFQPDLVLVCIFVGNDITETLATPRALAPEQHALYLFGRRGWRLLQEQQRGAPAAVADRLHMPLAAETYWEVETRRLQVCRVPVGPAMAKKWRRTLRDLERILASARCHQTTVAIVLIPDEYQVNPAVLAEALRRAGLAAGAIDVPLPQRRLQEFCRRQQVPCLDLLPVLQGRTDAYAPRDTHWNRQGNLAAAKAIHDWLNANTLMMAASP